MESLNKETLCPVCGYNLGFLPWSGDSSSDEICPSCGIQFGYHDAAGSDEQSRKVIYQKWRQQWIENGMQWDKGYSRPPQDWNPIEQLRHIGIDLRKSENESAE